MFFCKSFIYESLAWKFIHFYFHFARHVILHYSATCEHWVHQGHFTVTTYSYSRQCSHWSRHGHCKCIQGWFIYVSCRHHYLLHSTSFFISLSMIRKKEIISFIFCTYMTLYRWFYTSKMYIRYIYNNICPYHLISKHSNFFKVTLPVFLKWPIYLSIVLIYWILCRVFHFSLLNYNLMYCIIKSCLLTTPIFSHLIRVNQL